MYVVYVSGGRSGAYIVVEMFWNVAERKRSAEVDEQKAVEIANRKGSWKVNCSQRATF